MRLPLCVANCTAPGTYLPIRLGGLNSQEVALFGAANDRQRGTCTTGVREATAGSLVSAADWLTPVSLVSAGSVRLLFLPAPFAEDGAVLVSIGIYRESMEPALAAPG